MQNEEVRYAVDWVPFPGSTFARLGHQWTGWCSDLAQTQTAHGPLAQARRVARLDARLTLRGLHATVAGPFRPAGGLTEWGIEDVLSDFTQDRALVRCGRLEVQICGDHVVLAPSGHSPALEDTVAELRAILAPLIVPVALPVVRGFVLPLTGPLSPGTAEQVRDTLSAVFDPVMRDRPLMSNIALSESPGKGRPWRVIQRFPFAAADTLTGRRLDPLACMGPTLLSTQLYGEGAAG